MDNIVTQFVKSEDVLALTPDMRCILYLFVFAFFISLFTTLIGYLTTNIK